MSSNGEGLAWVVLSPIAILTDVAAIGFVCHYRPFYHGSDIMVVSLLVAMTMNALLVVPIPAFTELDYFQWNSILCKCYVWAFLTFRIAQMLTLSSICVHWSSIMQASTKNQNKGLTYRIKILSVVIWILSTIIGLLPVIGAVVDNFFENGSCMFLSSDIGIGFTIFIFIFVITCMLTAIISICDVTFLTKCMRKTANVRYGADRFYLPKKRSDIPASGSYSIQEKFNQLNFTWDLCRFFCFVISFCFIGNHLPFAILEFIQSTTLFNRGLVQEIIIWLILIEALVFPHLLWACSRRYRHALVYTWRVHIMRRPREEEDPMSCRLQSYSRKVRDVNGYVNNLSEVPDVTRNIPTSDPKTMDASSDPDNDSPHGQEIVLQAIHNGRIEYHRSDSTSPQKRQDSHEKPTEINLSTFQSVHTHTHNRNNSGGLTMKMGTADLHKSSPGGSRQEWKEQMRKKHLPPIFTNDSFHADINVLNVPDDTIHRSEGTCGSVHSLYYLSGDYHPDYLNTDSLPRHRLPNGSTIDSESDDVLTEYQDGDINQVLDEKTPVKSELSKVTHTNTTEVKQKRIMEVKQERITKVKHKPEIKQKPEIKHKPEVKPKPTPVKRVLKQKSLDVQNITNDAKQEENCDNSLNTASLRKTSVPLQNTLNSTRRPVSADEIDIYIYHAADGSDSIISDTEKMDSAKKESFSECVPNKKCKISRQTFVREPAEGYNENDNDPKNDQNRVMFESSQNQLSKENWTDMVQPILQKNETDELDVSLNSCDPTWQYLRNQKQESMHPVSHSPFDVETDRGFEEALSVEYESVRSMSSLTNDSFGDSFDTSNPFEFVDNFKNESFKTQAIVSKSRPPSCSTVDSDNPFDYVPIETRRDVIKRSSNYLENEPEQKPLFSTFKASNLNKNFENEHLENVFGEADLRNLKTSTPNTNCPWPSSQEKNIDNESNQGSPWPTTKDSYGDNAFVFESDFNTNPIQQSNVSSQRSSTRSSSANTRFDNTHISESQLDNRCGITMDVEPVFL